MSHTPGIGGSLRSPWLAYLGPDAFSPMSRPLREFSGLGRAVLHRVPEVTIAGGVTVWSPPITMAATDGRVVVLQLDATTWPTDSAKTLTIGLERSTDAGQSWRPVAAITTTSGAMASTGKPYVATNIDTDELLRCYITVTGTSLTVGGTVTGG